MHYNLKIKQFSKTIRTENNKYLSKAEIRGRGLVQITKGNFGICKFSIS
jgi:hypothetical protein